jgi:hypothetical protein
MPIAAGVVTDDNIATGIAGIYVSAQSRCPAFFDGAQRAQLPCI